MGMGLAELRAGAAAFAAAFDPARIAPADAERVVREAAALENIAATIKALAAARAAQGGDWRRNGARSPAHDLARKTGSTVGMAKEALETGEKLAELPELDAAARRGEVSAAQAAPIADAAIADPTAEERLLLKAKRASVAELRDECARTKAAAEADDEARQRAIHRSRSLRSFRAADGAGEIRYRSTLDEVAEVMAVIRGYGNREFDLARLDGRHEREDAYLADGLLAAARVAAGVAAGDFDAVRPAAPPAPGATAASDEERQGGAGGAPAGRVRKATPTKVIVRVDFDALLRGWPMEGEVCDIAGLGPVPVSAAQAMMASGDAFLAAVVTKGVDVAAVVHLGRKPTVYQDTALEWLSPACTTEGCAATVRLERDHRVDWSRSKITLLRWLDRLCARCHDQKTRHGWALVEGVGKRPLVPPEDPRHPKHHPPPLRDTG